MRGDSDAYGSDKGHKSLAEYTPQEMKDREAAEQQRLEAIQNNHHRGSSSGWTSTIGELSSGIGGLLNQRRKSDEKGLPPTAGKWVAGLVAVASQAANRYWQSDIEQLRHRPADEPPEPADPSDPSLTIPRSAEPKSPESQAPKGEP